MTNQPYQTDDVKLREYIEALIAEQRRYFEARLGAVIEATVLARESMDHRLDGMNEIRGVLRDQSVTMITRDKFDVAFERLQSDVNDLKKRSNIAEGKASQSSVIFFGFLSVASLIISIIKMFTG